MSLSILRVLILLKERFNSFNAGNMGRNLEGACACVCVVVASSLSFPVGSLLLFSTAAFEVTATCC